MGMILNVKVKEGYPKYKDYDIIDVTGRVSSIEYGRPYTSVPVRLDGLYNKASKEGFFYISKRFLQIIDDESTNDAIDCQQFYRLNVQRSSKTKLLNLEENKMETNKSFRETVNAYYTRQKEEFGEKCRNEIINVKRTSVAGKKLLAFLKEVNADNIDLAFDEIFNLAWLSKKEDEQLKEINDKYQELYRKQYAERVLVWEALEAADTFKEKISVLNAYGIINLTLYD